MCVCVCVCVCTCVYVCAHVCMCLFCTIRRVCVYVVDYTQAGRERKLDYDPTCVSYFLNGEYMLVGGCNRKVRFCLENTENRSLVGGKQISTRSTKAIIIVSTRLFVPLLFKSNTMVIN